MWSFHLPLISNSPPKPSWPSKTYYPFSPYFTFPPNTFADSRSSLLSTWECLFCYSNFEFSDSKKKNDANHFVLILRKSKFPLSLLLRTPEPALIKKKRSFQSFSKREKREAKNVTMRWNMMVRGIWESNTQVSEVNLFLAVTQKSI